MAKVTSASPGTDAPDFTLMDQDGRDWRLSEHFGRPIVLLFYPGDETPVCTRQMCSVRDRWNDYTAAGAEVIGISANTVESHRSFIDNHKLPMTLLSDPEHVVAKLYSVMSVFPGKMGRAAVVIDPAGKVSYRKFKALLGLLIRPKDDETLAAIKRARSVAKPEVV